MCFEAYLRKCILHASSVLTTAVWLLWVVMGQYGLTHSHR